MTDYKKPISALKDQLGRDIEIRYHVTLSYVVSAAAPCTKTQLVALVNDRIRAAGRVEEMDVDEYGIEGVGVI